MTKNPVATITWSMSQSLCPDLSVMVPGSGPLGSALSDPDVLPESDAVSEPERTSESDAGKSNHAISPIRLAFGGSTVAGKSKPPPLEVCQMLFE